MYHLLAYCYLKNTCIFPCVCPACLLDFLMVTLAAPSEVSRQAQVGTAMPAYLCLWLMDLILKLKKTACVSSLVR